MTDLETRLRETLDRHADRAELASGDAGAARPGPPAAGPHRGRLRGGRARADGARRVVGADRDGRAGAARSPVRSCRTRPSTTATSRTSAGPLDAARLVIRHRDGSVSTIDRTRFETEPCTPYAVVAMIEGTPRCGGFGSLLWSPDGARLAFVFQHRWLHPGDAPAGLYVVRADGSGLRKVGACPTHRGILPCDLTDGAGPTWSPDSSRIAVSGDGRIWTASVDGGGFRELTQCPPCLDSHPAWSPDGQSIAFARDDGVYEVVRGRRQHLAAGRAAGSDGTGLVARRHPDRDPRRGRRVRARRRRRERCGAPDRRDPGSPVGQRAGVVAGRPHPGVAGGRQLARAPPRSPRGPLDDPARRYAAGPGWSRGRAASRTSRATRESRGHPTDGRSRCTPPGHTATGAPQGVLVVDVASGRLRRIPGGDSASPAWRPVA